MSRSSSRVCTLRPTTSSREMLHDDLRQRAVIAIEMMRAAERNRLHDARLDIGAHRVAVIGPINADGLRPQLLHLRPHWQTCAILEPVGDFELERRRLAR